jgi:hypothetical protein
MRTEEVTTQRTLFKADMEAIKAYFLKVVAETIDASGGWAVGGVGCAGARGDT